MTTLFSSENVWVSYALRSVLCAVVN